MESMDDQSKNPRDEKKKEKEEIMSRT